MGSIEPIACKFFEQIENLVRFLFRDLVYPFAAFDESLALFRHFLDVLFTHGPAKQISPTKRVSAQDLHGLHHLFLIDQNSVGFSRHLFQ